MRDPTKLDELLDRLLAKTISGELRWKRGMRPGSFQVDFPDYSIIASHNRGLHVPLMGEYSIEILDHKGETVLSVPERWGDLPDSVSDETLARLRRLLDTLEGSASPSELAINAILSRL